MFTATDLKINSFVFVNAGVCLEDPVGMANSVGPDRTAPIELSPHCKLSPVFQIL